jgi:hypothetical protein
MKKIDEQQTLSRGSRSMTITRSERLVTAQGGGQWLYKTVELAKMAFKGCIIRYETQGWEK